MQTNLLLQITNPDTGDIMSLDQIGHDIRARSSLITENIVIIGKTLIMVKSQIDHGHFAQWLQDSVEFSQSTANNFMRIAREIDYTPSLTSLPHSKILALLDVPLDEREQFAADHNVGDMSAREIKRLVKEKQVAEQEAERQRAAAQRSSDLADQYAERFHEAQSQLAEAQVSLLAANAKPPVEIPVEVPPADYEQVKAALEAEKARAKAAEAYAIEQEEACRKARQQANRLDMQQIEQSAGNDQYSPQELAKAVKAFMACMGALPHMSSYLATRYQDVAEAYGQSVDALAAWVQGMRDVMEHNIVRLVDNDASVQ